MFRNHDGWKTTNPMDTAEFDDSDYERAEKDIDWSEWVAGLSSSFMALLNLSEKDPNWRIVLSTLRNARDAKIEEWLRSEKEYGGFDG